MQAYPFSNSVATGVKKNQPQYKSLSIYPNPAGVITRIDLHELSEKTEYGIWDVSGRLMQSGVLNAESVDISSLAAGVYVIRVNDNGCYYFSRFVRN